MKNRQLYKRKFDRHNAIFLDVSIDEAGTMILHFENVPLTVLLEVANTLEYSGYCNRAEATEGCVTMIETDIMLCCAENLSMVVRDILDNLNYELEIRF